MTKIMGSKIIQSSICKNIKNQIKQRIKQLNIQIYKNIEQQKMSSKLSILTHILLFLGYVVSLQLCIKRINLNQFSQTQTIVFDTPFTLPPQFGYAIENISLHTNQSNLAVSVLSNNLASCELYFNLTLVNVGPLSNFIYIDVVLFFVNDPFVQIRSITNVTQMTIPYIKAHQYTSLNSYSLTIFTNIIPCIFNIITQTSIGFTIGLGTTNSLDLMLTYVLVQKAFISSNIFIVFDKITSVALDYYLQIDEQGYLMPSDQNSFQGIMGIWYNGTDIDLNRLIVYDTFDQNRRAIKTGYLPSIYIIDSITAGYINFNPRYQSCPLSSFMSYSSPFNSVPQSCLPCDYTCSTCTSSELDSTYTDNRFCTTCPAGRQILILNNFSYGKCLCMLGYVQDSNGNCIPCQFNCLDFNVYFLKSSTTSTFLLIFNFPDLTFQKEFKYNLKVYVDQQICDYEITTLRRGVYKIILSSQHLEPCQQTCQVSFKVVSPYKVMHSGEYLTRQYRNLTINDFSIVQSRLPKQLTQAFAVSSIIISVSSSTGQSSLIKMLFQLEQIIDVHKYLNLEIPVVFKQFVEALSSFRFLDLTTLITFDINSYLKSLSIDELDCKGSAKIVYYESGVNFYKNMVAVVLSFSIILVINFIIYLVLKIIPTTFTQKLAQKIKLRWLITLSDMLQSMAIPISLFGFSQFSYIIKKYQLLWVYCISQIFCVFIFLFPFYVVSRSQNKINRYANKNGSEEERLEIIRAKELRQLEIQIAEDLLQDCSIEHRLTYIFYVYNFLRKFLFGMILAQYNQSGFSQGFVLLFVNLIQLCMMCYIIFNKIFKSKAKIFTRTINLLCIIIIQSLIIGYNMGKNNLESKILIGVTCTYVALISTGLGIVQLFIKLFDVLCQSTLNKKSSKQQDQMEKINNNSFIQNINENVVKCSIAVNPIVFNFEENSSQPSQDNNKSQIQYKDPDAEKDNELFKKQTMETKNRKDSIYRTTIYELNSQDNEIAVIGSQNSLRQEAQQILYKRRNKKKNRVIAPAVNNFVKDEEQISNSKLQNNKNTIQYDEFEQIKPATRKKNRIRIEPNIKNNDYLQIKQNKKRNQLAFLQNQSSNSQIAYIQQD